MPVHAINSITSSMIAGGAAVKGMKILGKPLRKKKKKRTKRKKRK